MEPMTGTGHPAVSGDTADPLAGALPLLRALPTPAVLFRLDGTIVAASPAMEELIGGPVEGFDRLTILDRLRIGFPAGIRRSWDDLCHDLARERHPSISIDIFDSAGRFHAMVASAGMVEGAGGPIGVVVVFYDVTMLVESGPGRARARGS